MSDLNCSQEKSSGDGHTEFIVVVVLLGSIGIEAIRLLEYENQVRSFGEIFLVPICLQRSEVSRPLNA